jgi:hypothetical protein
MYRALSWVRRRQEVCRYKGALSMTPVCFLLLPKHSASLVVSVRPGDRRLVLGDAVLHSCNGKPVPPPKGTDFSNPPTLDRMSSLAWSLYEFACFGFGFLCPSQIKRREMEGGLHYQHCFSWRQPKSEETSPPTYRSMPLWGYRTGSPTGYRCRR